MVIWCDHVGGIHIGKVPSILKLDNKETVENITKEKRILLDNTGVQSHAGLLSRCT